MPRDHSVLANVGKYAFDLSVATILTHRFPREDVGQLTRRRQQLSHSGFLGSLGRAIGVPQCLLVGKSMPADPSDLSLQIVAEGVEAIIGATYLDSGFSEAFELVYRLVEPRLTSGRTASGVKGSAAKVQLQEWAQKTFRQLPKYSYRHAGPNHSTEWTAVVSVAGRPLGEGTAASKKLASQAACANAISLLKRKGRWQ